ncbi:auxin efflux carrier [Flammula alnicola]|nr:auxin efflux carrier [Flammula alnicola]
MVSAGTLIWISCRPLLRLVFCVSCGFAITKADIFPAIAAAGAGQMLLNITLPSLMFSKIVPAFTAQNVSALGPLVLVALLYEAMGIILAYIVKQFFWVPHRFRYGILVAGGWGNVGDIPTSVIMSVTGAAPFHGVADQNLAVAYISAFILVFMVTLFPFGGHKWVAWDFVGPDVEPEEIQEAMRLKRKAFFHPFKRVVQLSAGKNQDHETSGPDEKTISENEKKDRSASSTQRVHHKHVSFMDDASTMVPTEGIASPVGSPPPTERGFQHRVNSLEPTTTMTGIDAPNAYKTPSLSNAQKPNAGLLPTHASVDSHGGARTPSTSNQPHGTSRSRRFRINIKRRHFVDFIKAFFTPCSMAILVSFPIALIPKLKALFVEVPGTYMPSAPDGQPPLAFVLDATSFVGAASVPLGLVCLGSSLARLPFPRKGEWQMLPLGAIGWLAVGKMVVMPVLGVIICEGLTSTGVISRDDKVLRFVCIFFSCLPTATVHVLLTQVYSGTGSAEHLSPFLIPQYILMFISMTALTAYTIQLLF